MMSWLFLGSYKNVVEGNIDVIVVVDLIFVFCLFLDCGCCCGWFFGVFMCGYLMCIGE